MDDAVTLYSRPLPGGGLVKIEAVPAVPRRRAECQARVLVERRRDPKRRAGHAPPVIAQVEAQTEALALSTLFEIASDNVAIASRLIRWKAETGRGKPGERGREDRPLD
ncbi:MAG TPA: hypothetical protein VFW98_12065 [Gemmatimonadaceae bacterium]|nr:hypothetical protein [Gemmatimonadaceae bacterium]